MGAGADPDPTEVSDVVAVAASEPTEMAGVAEADTAAAYAWAEADDQELDLGGRRMTPRMITSVAVAVSLAVVVGAGIVAFIHLRDRAPEMVAGSPSTTSTVVPVATAPPQPPPVTVTTVVIQAPPQPTMQDPAARSDDAYFLELLAKDGLTPANPRSAIAAAAAKCWEIQNGTSRGRAVLNSRDAGMSYEDAVAFVADSIAAYCPRAGL